MDSTAASTETSWKPKPWVAVVLALFVAPFSMLYLGRPRFALYYFVALMGVALTEYGLTLAGMAPWSKDISIVWALAIAFAIHAYKLAKRGPFPLPRVWYSRWYGLLAIWAALAALSIGARSFLYEPFRIPSVSMKPGLRPGAIVIVQKLGVGNYGTFGFNIMKMPLSEKIERGDVFVFQYPLDPKIDYIKRIIGLPGDTVSYKSKVLYVNNVKMQVTPQADSEIDGVVEEHYGDKSWQTIITSRTSGEIPDFEGKVPEHQYFVLGDNRDNSSDSRIWGFVPEANLVGKVVYTGK